MKVIFLDVDGVLNCKETWKGPLAPHLCDLRLSRLGHVVTITDAKIVVSSTWRLYSKGLGCTGLFDRLMEYGIEIFDKTPDISPRSFRFKEIQAWLEQHPEVTKYAILDDDLDAGMDLKDNFFKTSFQTGLTPEIANAICKHLED